MKNNKIFKKYIFPLLIVLIISFISLFIFVVGSVEENRYQYLNNIEYNVKINDDGSMRVTEIWDIYTSNTTTLFKTFDKSDKYGEITNVSVKDLDNDIIFSDYETWVYYAPENYYYADDNKEGDFEIGWGLGENSKKRKFQVSYTVTDVMSQYSDCQEFYWQFLGKGKNSVPADKVKGTITLPKEVSNLENLKIWAHGEVNGNINKVDNKTVEFTIDKLSPKAMIEVRLVTKENIAENISILKTKYFNYYNAILKEEKAWSDETNQEITENRLMIKILIGIELLIILIIVIKIILLINKSKQKGIEKHNLKYYRDFPRENESTPSEALYMTKYDKKRIEASLVQRNAIASTILDLCLKKKIELSINEKDTMVKIISGPEGLKSDELEVYELLKKAGNKDEIFKIEELNKYAKKKYYQYSSSINKIINSTRENLYNLKLIDKANEKTYLKGESAQTKYSFLKYSYIFVVVTHLLAIIIPFFKRRVIYNTGFGFTTNLTYFLIAILPLVLIKLYYLKKQEKILGNIAVLTQQGNDEKEQWIGLKNYLKDYSLLKEKDIPDLVLWEKYLVYATAFGISEKVIESMKATYPEVFVKENWNDEEMARKYPLLNYACNPIYIHNNESNYSPIANIDSNVSKAYHTSMTEIAAHQSSSSGGSGGGFSGGRRRRWRPVAGMGGR